MNEMWYKHDYFVYDSFAHEPSTTNRQILIGQVERYEDNNYYFEPLYFNKEWERHNYYPDEVHAHRWHENSPMQECTVKVTKEEAEAARLVLL